MLATARVTLMMGCLALVIALAFTETRDQRRVSANHAWEYERGSRVWTRIDSMPAGEYDDARARDFIEAHSCRFDPEGFCGQPAPRTSQPTDQDLAIPG